MFEQENLVSLTKNRAVRAPYMHEGRFASLEEVNDHFNDGVEDSPNVRSPLSMGPQENMSQQEKTLSLRS